MDFSGRDVMVTGGAGALGTAVVDALLKAGARCYVPYRQEQAAGRFPIPPDAAVTLIPAPSLADEKVVEEIYAEVPALWASIHVAGGFAFAPIAETSGALLRRQIDDNLVSCFLCCREAVKTMRARGQGGRIVNVAARQALEPRIGAKMSAYAAAKAGVAALTAALAEEVVPEGILVNAVAPSIMDTPANRRDMPKADHAAWPKVDEVAATILFLA
ncbi:MAG TPA: SDR family NAD(P)-dependent oxidoreductase, partial [Dongiaceae bacterium]|nr:SDR family NAD(P)-dependent oxidoreductase [Dongiaceae bacterium]